MEIQNITADQMTAGALNRSLMTLVFLLVLSACASAGTTVMEGSESSRPAAEVEAVERVESDEPVMLTVSAVPIVTDITAIYRTNIINERALSVPGKIQTGIFSNPIAFIEPLVEHLTADQDDDFARVKNLHDWIAQNIAYDVDGFFSGNISGQGYEAVLLSGNSVCEGYSGLLDKMCDIAGIECVPVRGYARGYGYDIFAEEDTRNTNHAWNAVHIDGTWYLIDCTWDAGYVRQNEYTRRYSTQYLFLEPEKMIYTHYPVESNWQLLRSHISPDQFITLPQLDGMFFQFGIDIPAEFRKINRTGSSYQLILSGNSNVRMAASFNDDTGQRRNAFIQYRDGLTEITFRFPSPGQWRATLYGRFGEGERYEGCGEVGFVASEGSAQLFPTQYLQFFEQNCYLHQPFYSPLKAGSKEVFKLTIPGATQAAIVIDGEWTMLERVAEGSDNFTVELVVPETEQVILYAKWGEEADYRGLLSFAVEK